MFSVFKDLLIQREGLTLQKNSFCIQTESGHSILAPDNPLQCTADMQYTCDAFLLLDPSLLDSTRAKKEEIFSS